MDTTTTTKHPDLVQTAKAVARQINQNASQNGLGKAANVYGTVYGRWKRGRVSDADMREAITQAWQAINAHQQRRAQEGRVG
jgi:hypothetical protein